MYEVEGRRVFISTGKLTQTVNICDANNVRGRYESTVRIRRGPSKLKIVDLPAFAKVQSFISWLRNSHGGEVEEPPEFADRDSKIRIKELVSLDDRSWISGVERIIESCIDSLVKEFVSMPYLHRVEHSMHVYLIERLRAHECLATRVPISGSTEETCVTQLIHKEWPETVPRRDLNGDRRGNFDIGILSPASIRASTLNQFRDGRIRPAIAIEMGLDYSFSHLIRDTEKLVNSTIPRAYIVHLDRTRTSDKKLAEAIELAESCSSSIRVAVGIALNGSTWIKRVRDDALHSNGN